MLQLYPVHTTCPWPAYMFYMLHILGTHYHLTTCHPLVIHSLTLPSALSKKFFRPPACHRSHSSAMVAWQLQRHRTYIICLQVSAAGRPKQSSFIFHYHNFCDIICYQLSLLSPKISTKSPKLFADYLGPRSAPGHRTLVMHSHGGRRSNQR